MNFGPVLSDIGRCDWVPTIDKIVLDWRPQTFRNDWNGADN
jgi:hypothetical protein